MKKIIASLFLLFLANSFYGQNKGITYQAVIYSPDAIVLPGQDNMLAPLTSQEVCMRFSFLDEGLTSEYEETITVITDGFGMVNLTLGQAAQSGGYASGFEEMTWDGTSKNLMVELDVSGNCFEFVEISNTTLSYVPFAMYAVNKENTQAIADNAEEISLLQEGVGVINTLQSGYLYVGNSSNVATETPSTGTGNVVRAIDATLTGNTSVTGTLDVTGATSLTTLGTSGLATLNSAAVTNDATVGGDLAVTGSISGNIIGDITGNAVTVTNGVYTTSSVTALSDVTSVGSGAIITAAERTKLAGVETIAVVINATNVAAAGALMDSEVQDLVGIKAVTVSTLQLKPSEGAFVDGDKTKLDGVEADLDANEIASNNADAALQADVDANEIASNNADATLG